MGNTYGWIERPYPTHIHLIYSDARIYTEYMENLAALSRGDTPFGAMSEEQGYKPYAEYTKKSSK